MTSWRKFLVLGLVVCLMRLSCADMAMASEPGPAPDPVRMKERVGQLGAGAKVKVTLATGQKLGGTIQSTDEEAFLLASAKGTATRRLPYDQVARLRYAKLTYRAASQPDPLEAKRVAAGLGVGQHIMVKTAAGKEYHGNIQAIEANHFTILPDRQMAPVQLPYPDVVQLGPNISKGAKIAIVALVGFFVLAAILAESMSD